MPTAAALLRRSNANSPPDPQSGAMSHGFGHCELTPVHAEFGNVLWMDGSGDGSVIANECVMAPFGLVVAVAVPVVPVVAVVSGVPRRCSAAAGSAAAATSV